MMSRILQEQNEFITNLSSSFTTSLNQKVTQSLDEPHCSVRLPRLNVPTFAGEYKEFPSFKDLYTASVHSKIGLNDVEKFQYLRGYLRGEAADLIKHITISEANYTQAWNKLCVRYDKRKYVLNSMIKHFIEQPAMQQGSSKKLRQLFNNADEVTRGIDALGGEATNRDPWLIYLLLHKTDLETQQAWAHRTVNQEFPTFAEFLKFISERCDVFESCEPTTSVGSRPHVTKSHQFQLHTSAGNIECLLCDGAHKLQECEKFKGLKVDDRRQQAAKLHVCFNCLSFSHLANRCLSQRGCSTCGRRHHTLLHNDVGINHCITSSSSSDSSTPNTNQFEVEPCQSSSTSVLAKSCKFGTTLLPTAIVNVKNQYGQFAPYTMLLDSGSQISCISQRLVKELGIRCKPGRVRLEGLATSNVSTIGSATIEIYSRFDIKKTLNY